MYIPLLAFFPALIVHCPYPTAPLIFSIFENTPPPKKRYSTLNRHSQIHGELFLYAVSPNQLLPAVYGQEVGTDEKSQRLTTGKWVPKRNHKGTRNNSLFLTSQIAIA